MWLMQHIKDKYIAEWTKIYAKHLQKIADEDFNYIEDMVQYLSEKSDTKDVTKVFDFFSDILTKEKVGKIMTYADQLREEGKILGVQQGLQRGKLEVAGNLLSQDISEEIISATTGLSISEVNKFKS